eukprot:254161_1
MQHHDHKDCWFYHTHKGCRYGPSCNFKHEIKRHSVMGESTAKLLNKMNIIEENQKLLWQKLTQFYQDDKHIPPKPPDPSDEPISKAILGLLKMVVIKLNKMEQSQSKTNGILTQPNETKIFVAKLNEIEAKIDSFKKLQSDTLRQTQELQPNKLRDISKDIRDIKNQLRQNPKSNTTSASLEHLTRQIGKFQSKTGVYHKEMKLFASKLSEKSTEKMDTLIDSFRVYFKADNVSNEHEVHNEADALFMSMNMVKDQVSSLEKAFNLMTLKKEKPTHSMCEDMIITSDCQVEKITKKMCKDTLISESKVTSKWETNPDIDAELKRYGITRTGDCWTHAEIQRS